MKNENPGDKITNFVALRPKVYSFETESGANTNKVKGCSSKGLSFARYRHVLDSNSSTFQTRCQIQSRHMSMSTVEATKMELTPFDDKRYILKDKVTTLPYGHFSLDLD